MDSSIHVPFLRERVSRLRSQFVLADLSTRRLIITRLSNILSPRRDSAASILGQLRRIQRNICFHRSSRISQTYLSLDLEFHRLLGSLEQRWLAREHDERSEVLAGSAGEFFDQTSLAVMGQERPEGLASNRERQFILPNRRIERSTIDDLLEALIIISKGMASCLLKYRHNMESVGGDLEDYLTEEDFTMIGQSVAKFSISTLIPFFGTHTFETYKSSDLERVGRQTTREILNNLFQFKYRFLI